MYLTHGPVMEAGSFPWGLLIIAGLIYLIWNKNSGRPWGRGFDNHQMHSGPQALFDQWHREAHQAAAQPQGGQPFVTQPQAPFGTPQAPFTQQPQAPYAPQPQAPAPPAAPTQANADATGTPPASQSPQPPTAGSPGPALERW